MAPLVVMDLDGTLVDSVPDLAAAVNRLMLARGIAPYTETAVAGMVGDGAPALVGRAFAARGLVQDAAALADFLADYGAHAAVGSRVYPGVPEALQAMAARGWKLAVCTNKPAAAAHVLLDALGLSRFFAAIGGGDSFPTYKPDPAHVLATIAAAGGDPGHAVMVGDHHNDVVAARGAGLPCIFAAWGYGPASMGSDAAATAESISAVPALAASLFNAGK